MLINDMRSLAIMRETGYPICFDATHSVQQPTSMGDISGGQREFIPHLVRASCATGIMSWKYIIVLKMPSLIKILF